MVGWWWWWSAQIIMLALGPGLVRSQLLGMLKFGYGLCRAKKLDNIVFDHFVSLVSTIQKSLYWKNCHYRVSGGRNPQSCTSTSKNFNCTRFHFRIKLLPGEDFFAWATSTFMKTYLKTACRNAYLQSQIIWVLYALENFTLRLTKETGSSSQISMFPHILLTY